MINLGTLAQDGMDKVMMRLIDHPTEENFEYADRCLRFYKNMCYPKSNEYREVYERLKLEKKALIIIQNTGSEGDN